ncbi:MAG: Flp family type IVb pilin [Pseudomonadota bacterium]
MLQKIQEFSQDESGLTFVEYGLVASIVSLIGFPAWTFFGETVTAWFVNVDSGINVAMASL